MYLLWSPVWYPRTDKPNTRFRKVPSFFTCYERVTNLPLDATKSCALDLKAKLLVWNIQCTISMLALLLNLRKQITFFFNTFCGYILPQIKIIIIMNLSLLQTRMG